MSVFANVVVYVFLSICICTPVCVSVCVFVCVCVLMCPWLRLVGTTLSCLSAHVNAKPAHMKHDDVFLFCFFFLNMCMECVCVLCVFYVLTLLFLY